MKGRFNRRALAVLFWLAVNWSIIAAPSIIPLPQIVQSKPGYFLLCPAQPAGGLPAQATTTIFTDNTTRRTGRYLAEFLSKSTGYRFPVESDPGTAAIPGAIVLTTANSSTNLGAEGYDLNVLPDSIVIRAPTDAGV